MKEFFFVVVNFREYLNFLCGTRN